MQNKNRDADIENLERGYHKARRNIYSRIRKPVQYGSEFFISRVSFCRSAKISQGNFSKHLREGHYKGIALKNISKEEYEAQCLA